jgi:ubiquinone/menaquinone biosynthesis C-methylase UbiE
MGEHKFNPDHAARLLDPKRLETLRPDAMWAAADVAAPRVIVDIGAGAGLITTAFARLAPEATVYAADISEAMLGWLKEHLPEDVADRVVPVLGTETHVPLPDGIADLVTMVALYHELDDAPATLADVARLLGPGGRLLIVDWVKDEAVEGPPLAHRVSTEDILAAVTAAGFGVPRNHDVLEGFSVVTATRLRGCSQHE